MSVADARKTIERTVLNWPGVTVQPHQYGGREYRLGRREIGHLHGDHLLDIPFPKRVRNELVSSGRADPHHVLPESGWISFYLREPPDVGRAVALLKVSYDLAAKRKKGRAGNTNGKKSGV